MRRLAVLALALAGAAVSADPLPHGTKQFTPRASAVTCLTTATALPNTGGRSAMCVYNAGSASVWIGSSTVTAASGFTLPAGGVFCDDLGNVAYYCIASGSSVAVRVLEN